jgi:hypothetical protein
MGSVGQSGPEVIDKSLDFETINIQPHQHGEDDSDPVSGFQTDTFSVGAGVESFKLARVNKLHGGPIQSL